MLESRFERKRRKRRRVSEKRRLFEILFDSAMLDAVRTVQIVKGAKMLIKPYFSSLNSNVII